MAILSRNFLNSGRNIWRKSYRDWKIDGEKLVENENGRIFGSTYDSGNLYYFKERFLEPGPFETKVIVQLAEYNLKTGGGEDIGSIKW